MANRYWKLGVVSYLNACPLTEGLAGRDGVELCYAVPAELPDMLIAGKVDAALIPVIDFLRRGEELDIVSDACIASDGETLTVRVFSRVPPESVDVLRVDGESHTSVVLAQILWSGCFHRRPAVLPLEPDRAIDEKEAVLLIGDKVVRGAGEGFAHDLDLGGLWKEWTGFPFVFAAWVARQGLDRGDLAGTLSQARDAGVARAEQIARARAAEHGWPEDLACEYLTEKIKFTLGPKYLEGMTLFFELALKLDIADAGVPQPEEVVR